MKDLLEGLLVPEALLAERDADIRALVRPVAEKDGSNIDDPRWGTEIARYFLFMSPDLVRKLGLDRLSDLDCYYNAYYWALKTTMIINARLYGSYVEPWIDDWGYDMVWKSPYPLDENIIMAIDAAVGWRPPPAQKA